MKIRRETREAVAETTSGPARPAALGVSSQHCMGVGAGSDIDFARAHG